MRNHKIYKVFVIEWLKLPSHLQDIVREKERFQNDCYLEHFSEFEPHEYAKGMSIIEEYWEDQKQNNPDGIGEKTRSHSRISSKAMGLSLMNGLLIPGPTSTVLIKFLSE